MPNIPIASSRNSLTLKIIRHDGNEETQVIVRPKYRIGRSPDMDLQLNEKDVASFHAKLEFLENAWYVQNTSGMDGALAINSQEMPRNMIAVLNDNDVLSLGENVKITVKTINKPVQWQNQVPNADYTDSSSEVTVVDLGDEIFDDPDDDPPPIGNEKEEEPGFGEKYGKILWIVGGCVIGCILAKVILVLLSSLK